MHKRGQSSPTNVATLIAIIGAAIIVYILMLPPQDRADLLGQNDSTLNGGRKTNISILLEQEPGTLEYLQNDIVEIEFPSFNLYTRTDAVTLAEFDSVFLKKSLFDKQFVNKTFEVDDLRFTDNILLSFFAKKFDGRLTIRLNGNILLDRMLDTSSPGPVQLPKEMLKKDINVIEFEISGPGLEFWKSNEYLLEDIKITADVTDTSGQENKQVFLLTEKEKRLLEYAELVIIPDCQQTEVAPLEIYINKKLIYSSVPDCGVRMPIPQITEDKLKEGDNYITFRSDKGSYLIYGVKLKLKLEEPIYPTYFFQVSNNEYLNAKNKKADLNLSIVFPNKIDYKKGVVLVNEIILEIETKDNYYVRDIRPYIREGNNAVEIRPKTNELDVVELKVIYAE
jgi:hypothetical protein